jgi:hypothetical protein
MNPMWAIFLPAFVVLIFGIAGYLAVRLKFFSRKARELVFVHRDFKEVRIDEFGMLVCAEADNLVNYEWRLTRAERRMVAAERIKRARGFLRRIAVNGALSLEVARFQIRKIEKETGNRLLQRDHLSTRLFDRAAMCHFMAAVCLARMYFLEFCMIALPFYVPDFSGRFEVRGYDLVVWYEHLVEDVLEVASEDERHWLYENTLFMLTGLVAMPEE